MFTILVIRCNIIVGRARQPCRNRSHLRAQFTQYRRLKSIKLGLMSTASCRSTTESTMSIETKKRLILRNLLHINTNMDTKQRSHNGVLVQVSANIWPVTPRPKTRGTGAALPFQKRVQRAIGHIAGARAVRSATGDKPTSRYPIPTPTPSPSESSPSFQPQRVTLRYRR